MNETFILLFSDRAMEISGVVESKKVIDPFTQETIAYSYLVPYSVFQFVQDGINLKAFPIISTL